MTKTIIMKTADGNEYVVREGSIDKFKKTVKRITIFASAVVMTVSGMRFALKNKEKDDLKTKIPEHYEMVDTSAKENSSITNKENSELDTNISSEMDIEFSKLKVLQQSYNMNYEEIREFIKKYSSYVNYSYEEALDIVYNNTINSNGNLEENTKTKMLYLIFDNAEKENRVNNHCEEWEKTTRYNTFPNSYYDVEEMNSKINQRNEIERELISFCDDMGIEGEDKYLALAIFRQETDHGASDMCVYDNNFGGIVFDNEFASFSNPEYGMFKTLDVIKRFINTAKSNGCYDIQSIIINMSSLYCTHTPEDWVQNVSSMYYDVLNDYQNTNSLVR